MIVYKVTNTVNNKVYIGKTVQTLKRRIAQHKHDSLKKDSQTKFHRAIRKYGLESFKWEVVCECDSNKELCEKEIYMIHLYDSIKNGYNVTKGGEGVSGFKHSEETKSKTSESRKGLTVGENHPQSKLTEEDVREIKILLMSGETQRTIAKRFNVSRGTITFIQKGEIWSHVDVEGFEPFNRDVKGEGNPCSSLTDKDVVDIKKLLLTSDKSQNEIAEMFKVSKHIISRIKLGKSWSHIKVDGEENFTKSFKTMSSEDIYKIKELIEEGLSLRKISSIIGFNKESIRKIKIKLEKGEI